MTYPPTIDVYGEACDEIRSWMTDWLSQHEFDRLSAQHRPQQRRVIAYTGSTIMPPVWGDPNLMLVQEMMRNKIIEAKETDGVIFYRDKAPK